MSILPRILRSAEFVLLHFRVRHGMDEPADARLRGTVRAPGGDIDLHEVSIVLPPRGRANVYMAVRADHRFGFGRCQLVTRCDYRGRTYASLDESTDHFEVLPGETDAQPFTGICGQGDDPRQMMALYFGAMQSADLRPYFAAGPRDPTSLEGACERDAHRFHAYMMNSDADAGLGATPETPVARELLARHSAAPTLAVAAYRLLDLPHMLRALADRPLRSFPRT